MSATDTVVLEDDHARAHSAARGFVRELKNSLASDDLDLPSLPEVALQIRRALSDENVSNDRIVQLVGSEPALAARLLKTANCALFHRGSQSISDLRTAVTRLGHRMVRNVSISLAAQQVFAGYAVKNVRPYLEAAWGHSVHVAAVAHDLAKHTISVHPDEAFLAGLLHEIGKLYILGRVKDHAELLESETAFQWVMAETQSDMGRTVMKMWAFSSELVDAVGDHESCSLHCANPPSLTEVVAVANFLANKLLSQPADEHVWDDLPSFGSLALDSNTMVQVICSSGEEVGLLREAFGA